MSLELIVTEAGRAALVNAAATGTSPVTITQAGLSATAITPTTAATTLPGELSRIATVGGIGAADDVIHVSIRDTTAAVYDLRSFALYLNDGTLFAIYGQPTPILSKTATATALIALDVVFADIASTAITFGGTNFTDPDATTSRKGLVELATTAEAQAGVDAIRAITPATLAAALLPLLLGSDGSGSGTDADLLDGQHGSYYANIAARLGFTPLDAATYTASNVLAKLFTVDGAGSGVDADMLDGQHGSYYANIAARLGFTPLDAASFTAASVLSRLLTVDGAGSGVDADLLDGQHGSYYANIPARLGFTPLDAATYTAANVLAKLLSVDGSGSGVDADLLDGKHASDFALAGDFASASASSGYAFDLPFGPLTLRVQLGQVRSGTSGGSSTTVTFPLAFTAAPLGVFFSTYDPSNSYNQTHLARAGATSTTATFRAINDDSGSSSVPGFDWIAFGFA